MKLAIGDILLHFIAIQMRNGIKTSQIHLFAIKKEVTYGRIFILQV
jgi:hypothetical protein